MTKRAQYRSPPPPNNNVKEIAASLIQQHQLTSSYHRAFAWRIAIAIDKGDLAEATRAIALLPPALRAIVSEPTVSPSAARKKIEDLIRNAVAAHQTEEGRAPENSEIAVLRAQVESLQDECRHLRGTRPRRLPKPTDKPVAKSAADPKTATPSPSPVPRAADPTRPGEWDASASGQAWHSWNNSGGAVPSGTYGPMSGSDGLPAQAWIDRLNRREW
jgi:hypothetical protein